MCGEDRNKRRKKVYSDSEFVSVKHKVKRKEKWGLENVSKSTKEYCTKRKIETRKKFEREGTGNGRL